MSDHSVFNIAHIISDEKFLSESLPLFLNTEGVTNNIFLMLDKRASPIKYLKNIDFQIIAYEKIKNFALELEKFHFIIFHSLIEEPKIKLLKCLNHSNILWIGWGHDYYSLLSEDELYSELTKAALLKCAEQKKDSLHLIGGLKNKVVKFFQKEQLNLSQLIKKVRYFSPVIKSEFDWVANKFNKDLLYLEWNYYVDQHSLSEYISTDANCHSILIGNSASPFNNHLDALEILKICNFKINKIYLPLSYGGDDWYKTFIKEEFLKHFDNNKLVFLENFLSLKEYINILAACTICIFPSYRQMALGNINHFISIGAKVFLNKKNPIFNFLIQNGIKLYSLDQLEKLHDLSYDQVLINKQNIKTLYSYQTLKDKTEKLIKELKKNYIEIRSIS